MVHEVLETKLLSLILLLLIHVEVRAVEVEQAVGELVAGEGPYGQGAIPLIEKPHSRYATAKLGASPSRLLNLILEPF